MKSIKTLIIAGIAAVSFASLAAAACCDGHGGKAEMKAEAAMSEAKAGCGDAKDKAEAKADCGSKMSEEKAKSGDCAK